MFLNWKSTEHGQSQGATLEWLGLIPAFINAFDPTPAAQQIDNNYQHGGGWRHMLPGWEKDEQHVLRYKSGEDPEDPPLKPLFTAEHDLGGGKMETLCFYDSAWMCIVQEDGSFEVSRVD